MPTTPTLSPLLPNVTSSSNWTDVTNALPADPPSWPTYLPLYVTILNVMIFFTGTLGNTLVIVVVVMVREMRTPMNWYLVNLSMADLLVLLVCQPAALLEFYAQDRWFLGAALCQLVPFLEHAVVHASTLIILSITVERYYAICRPLRKLAVCHRPRPLRVLPGVWATALLTSIPFTLMTSLHDTFFYDGTPCQVCGTSVQERWHYVYILVISLGFFALPLLLLLLLYFRIISALRTSGTALRSGQVRDASVASSHRSRKQVIKMLVCIVLLFFVTLLPVRCVILWQVFTPDGTIRGMGPEHYYNLMWVSRLLIYTNSAGNPIIYSLLSANFQQAFWRLLTGGRHAPIHHTQRGSQSSHRGSVSRWSVTGVQRGGLVSTPPGSSLRLLSLDSPSPPPPSSTGPRGARGGRLMSVTSCAYPPDSEASSPLVRNGRGEGRNCGGASSPSPSPLVKKDVVCSMPVRDRTCTTIL